SSIDYSQTCILRTCRPRQGKAQRRPDPGWPVQAGCRGSIDHDQTLLSLVIEAPLRLPRLQRSRFKLAWARFAHPQPCFLAGLAVFGRMSGPGLEVRRLERFGRDQLAAPEDHVEQPDVPDRYQFAVRGEAHGRTPPRPG